MSDAQDLVRALDTLREAIGQEWNNVGPMALTEKEQATLRLHIALCMDELATLLTRMTEADDDSSGKTSATTRGERDKNSGA